MNQNLLIGVLAILIILIVLSFSVPESPPKFSQNSTTTSGQVSGAPVEIISVTPVYFGNDTQTYSSGTKIAFDVALKNVGNVPIYLGQGCHYSIGAAIIPASAATVMPTGAGQCENSPYLVVEPGSSTVQRAPLFASITINKPGNVTAEFTLTWNTTKLQSESMTFTSNFTFT